MKPWNYEMAIKKDIMARAFSRQWPMSIPLLLQPLLALILLTKLKLIVC